MKSLVLISLLVTSLNSMASSEDQLKSCLQKTLSASSMELNRTDKASDVLKSMNQKIKSCKDQVKALVKAEKKRSKEIETIGSNQKTPGKIERLIYWIPGGFNIRRSLNQLKSWQNNTKH